MFRKYKRYRRKNKDKKTQHLCLDKEYNSVLKEQKLIK